MSNQEITRTAKVHGTRTSLEVIQKYLPDNYQALTNEHQEIVITGQDKAGWTMDEYVIPRLASGLIFAEEVDPITVTEPGIQPSSESISIF